jgi:hypothetical protein
MPVPGVPDSQLERLHWSYGGGRGALGLRHRPSGVVVAREYPPDVPAWRVMQELEAELKEKLWNDGVILNEPGPSSESA